MPGTDSKNRFVTSIQYIDSIQQGPHHLLNEITCFAFFALSGSLLIVNLKNIAD